MYLTKEELMNAFWKRYNFKGRAIRYQFGCSLHTTRSDLVTLEHYKDNWDLNAFEFACQDLKRAIEKAKRNLQYVNKSWIVIPDTKKEYVINKLENDLNYARLGVMCIADDGRYDVVLHPAYNHTPQLHQNLIKLILGGKGNE